MCFTVKNNMNFNRKKIKRKNGLDYLRSLKRKHKLKVMYRRVAKKSSKNMQSINLRKEAVSEF